MRALPLSVFHSDASGASSFEGCVTCSFPMIVGVTPQLCVPKTSSVLIARPNRLNVSGDDRALLAPPGPVRLTVQVKERTCGRERCAPTSIDCAAAEGARSRSTHEWGSLVLGHAISMVSIGPQGHHDRPSRDSRTLASSRLPSVLAVEIPLSRARSSGTAASCHMLSSVDCITTTSESEFSVHTGI
jgi:hypothetical protein